MGFFKNLFKKQNAEPKPLDVDLELNEEERQLIQDFARHNDSKRMVAIMALGDTGDPRYFRLLQYAILYDPNSDVKFSALKRLHLHKGHPELEPMLIKLKNEGKGDEMEPYFSMLLSRVGLITIEELERKINPG